MKWLEELITRVLSLIPRLQLINPDEGGIRITLGNRVKDCKPGWYIYWPLIQVFYVISVTPQIPDVRPQSVMTSDGQSFTVSGAIKYRIRDVRKSVLSVQDYDVSIQTLVCGVITRYCSTHTVDELLDVGLLEADIKKELQKEARGWGIEVMSCYITDMGNAINLRLLTGSIQNEVSY
ncbi:hypothetical protein LCGC14_1745770 [marine sediment metagenome]|uniref:Band 7 domain-containing protein n=1 Tax=marine sediment metagenome TaxID=412755 RepID=A0A0F9H5C2_9ZZZZ